MAVAMIAWNADRPRLIEILPGTHSNLSVTDEDGDKLSFSYDKETFGESKFIILNQKLGNYDLIVEGRLTYQHSWLSKKNEFLPSFRKFSLVKSIIRYECIC